MEEKNDVAETMIANGKHNKTLLTWSEVCLWRRGVVVSGVRQ